MKNIIVDPALVVVVCLTIASLSIYCLVYILKLKRELIISKLYRNLGQGERLLEVIALYKKLNVLQKFLFWTSHPGYEIGGNSLSKRIADNGVCELVDVMWILEINSEDLEIAKLIVAETLKDKRTRRKIQKLIMDCFFLNSGDFINGTKNSNRISDLWFVARFDITRENGHSIYDRSFVWD